MTDLPPPYHLRPEDWAAIQYVLNWVLPPATQVFAYGSRVHGQLLKPNSDLDLAIIWPGGTSMPFDTYLNLKQRLTEHQSLMIRVDITDYVTVEPHFRAIIDSHKQPLVWQKVFGSLPPTA